MTKLVELIPSRVRRALFVAAYSFFMVLSLFTIFAPRTLLERTHVYVWSWVLTLPPAWWFVGFVRSLYRGGE